MLRVKFADTKGEFCEYCEESESVLSAEINFGEGYDAIGSIICEPCLKSALSGKSDNARVRTLISRLHD